MARWLACAVRWEARGRVWPIEGVEAWLVRASCIHVPYCMMINIFDHGWGVFCWLFMFLNHSQAARGFHRGGTSLKISNFIHTAYHSCPSDMSESPFHYSRNCETEERAKRNNLHQQRNPVTFPARPFFVPELDRHDQITPDEMASDGCRHHLGPAMPCLGSPATTEGAAERVRQPERCIT